MREVNELSMYEYFMTLEVPFRCGRINMWNNENRYDYIPNFKFKFLNLEKNHSFYKQLNGLIENFSGNIKWELYTNQNSSNYIIKPKTETERLSSEDSRKKIIDISISDLPSLIEFLKNGDWLQTKEN